MFTEEQIAELRTKHGRIEHVVGADDLWEVVLVQPKSADIKMYKHQLHDPTLRPDAQEILFRKMVVAAWTATDGECDAAKLLAFAPMAPEGCSDSVGQLIGISATRRVKA